MHHQTGSILVAGSAELPICPLDRGLQFGHCSCVSEPTHLSTGASAALRTFAYWIANGTLGRPLLDGIDYWSEMKDSPSLLEQTVAIFANVLTFDDEGEPTNVKEAERRAALWVRQYCTGVPADPPLEGWEVALH